VLSGHTSTIRCIRVLHNRPIAVSGSRDGTVRVWDIQRGRALRVLQGHQHSVRCLDVCGNKIVSGSYDTTCRVSIDHCICENTSFILISWCSFGMWTLDNAYTFLEDTITKFTLLLLMVSELRQAVLTRLFASGTHRLGII
jgi:hypothetical protein